MCTFDHVGFKYKNLYSFLLLLFLFPISCDKNEGMTVPGCDVEPEKSLASIDVVDRPQVLMDKLDILEANFNGCHRITVSCSPEAVLDEDVAQNLTITGKPLEETDVLVMDTADPAYDEYSCDEWADVKLSVELGGGFSAIADSSSAEFRASISLTGTSSTDDPDYEAYVATTTVKQLDAPDKQIRMVFSASNGTTIGSLYFESSTGEESKTEQNGNEVNTTIGSNSWCDITSWNSCE